MICVSLPSVRGCFRSWRISVLFLLPLLLTSCSIQDFALREGRLLAEAPIPYESYVEAISLPDDEMIVLRDPEEDVMVLERLRSDLSRAWAVPLPLEGEIYLSQGLVFAPSKRRKEVRVPLFYDDTNIGLFYEEERGENRILTLALFDSDEGGLLKQVPLDTFPVPSASFPVRAGEFRMSPDRRSFAVYSYDYSKVLYGDGLSAVDLHVTLYSTRGEKIGSAAASFSVGLEPDEADEVDAALPPPLLTAAGEFIQPVVVGNELLAVVVDPRSGSDRVVKVMNLGEEEVGLVRMQSIAGSAVGVGVSVMDGDEVVGVSYTTLDAEHATAGTPWRYIIDDDQAEALVEDDLGGFIFESMIVAPDGSPTFILEYQKAMMLVELTSRTIIYEHNDIAILSFNATGSLKNAVAFDNEQKEPGLERTFMERPVADGLKFVVTHYDKGQLLVATAPNSGTLTTIPVLEPAGGSWLRFSKSFWNDDRTVTLIISDLLNGSDEAKVMRVALP